MTDAEGPGDYSRQLDEVAALLADARRVLFITGAGVSADSGLPTYRGLNGIYEDASTEEGYSIEDALSGEMLAFRPAITWKYLAQIEHACRDAKPNAAHHAMVALESRLDQVLVLTQNIDGLHRAAGSSSLIEIHGSMHHLVCARCGAEEEVPSFAGRELPPVCRSCGAQMRPNVVLFGEALGLDNLVWLERELELGFDMVFSVGTSSTFPYIIEPVVRALRRGVPTVEINPGDTPLSDAVDYRLKAGAAAAMDALLRRLP